MDQFTMNENYSSTSFIIFMEIRLIDDESDLAERF
jgi:hypothetical protein